MGITTLIKTVTASDDSEITFVDGTSSVVFDSTYDEYMFVFTGLNPSTDQVKLMFQCNAAGASGYNESVVAGYAYADHCEDDSDASYQYDASYDQVGTSDIIMSVHTGSDADQTVAGILHLFSPASTTYVTHFYWDTQSSSNVNCSINAHGGGLFNLTAAIDEIRFYMSSGNFDGTIEMYGIA